MRSDDRSRLRTGVMFNAYPDSCGGTLGDAVALLARDELNGAFSLFYILPSMFRSDLDRGFSVISYDLERELATRDDLRSLGTMGIGLKLDFVLNHLSMQSPQFQDLLAHGDDSRYVNAFIDWNQFWEDEGTLSDEGYIVPYDRHLSKLFMRKPGLPILEVPFPDGSYRFYWNTFYQDVSVSPPTREALRSLEGVDDSNVEAIDAAVRNAVQGSTTIHEALTHEVGDERLARRVQAFVDRHCTTYRGQMDLNAESEVVWDFYEDTIEKLAAYGADIVRLDAFAYLHKEVGRSNFFNEPGTWEYLDRLREIADRRGITLLPEIHAKHEDGIHRKLADHGYAIYDFFFPVLVIHAIESAAAGPLIDWIREVIANGYRTVTMLGCHDGIPVLDVKGLLDDEAIDGVIDVIVDRGGRVKDLYGPDGKKISYYQVNATFFSALGESEDKLLLARAVQMFMPGTPQVWYLDIFAGTNDYDAADHLGHKDINRTNLETDEIERRLERPVVSRQLSLMRLRNTHPAFAQDAHLTVESVGSNGITLTWRHRDAEATLSADLATCTFEISCTGPERPTE
jgi:sucrose phosphorylase